MTAKKKLPLNSFGRKHCIGDPKYCFAEIANAKNANNNEVE